MKFFITGGAGFIGTKLITELQKNSSTEIFVLDNLNPQVHGENAEFPKFGPGVTCIKCDVRDGDEVKKHVKQIKPTHVVHLAAETGTGQSMDEIHRYCSVNIDGTALLIEALAPVKNNLQQFILASSRAVYGEGAWLLPNGQVVVPESRRDQDLAAGRFNPQFDDGTAMVALKEPIATKENTPASPVSIYASTKLMQEYLLKQSPIADKTLSFRFQNVYGAGQSLRNPYTGVLSIFCSQLIQNKNLEIYEDGNIIRDFVTADDIVQGLMLAIDKKVSGEIINLGSAFPASILSAAQTLCTIFGKDPAKTLTITGKYRLGDIRHACADISKAKKLLQWTPKISFQQGLENLAQWSQNEWR